MSLEVIGGRALESLSATGNDLNNPVAVVAVAVVDNVFDLIVVVDVARFKVKMQIRSEPEANKCLHQSRCDSTGTCRLMRFDH